MKEVKVILTLLVPDNTYPKRVARRVKDATASGTLLEEFGWTVLEAEVAA